MKTTILFVSALAMLTFSSCSQEEDTAQEQQRQEFRSPSSVKDLTAQLKTYNSQFYTPQEERAAVARLPKITYSKLDMIKIGISDVKGGIRGAGGAVGGIIVGAASSSLLKFATMTAKKLVVAYLKEQLRPHKLFGLNNNNLYSDSIGYYHNSVEYAMYSSDPGCYRRSSSDILNETCYRIANISNGFRSDGISGTQMLKINHSLDEIRELDADQYSFVEYCNKLKALNPEDSDYIDYCAEYLYAAVYANLSSLDDYTGNVVYQIRNSNVAVKDKRLLYNLVQVAYASVVLSQNLQFKNKSNN